MSARSLGALLFLCTVARSAPVPLPVPENHGGGKPTPGTRPVDEKHSPLILSKEGLPAWMAKRYSGYGTGNEFTHLDCSGNAVLLSNATTSVEFTRKDSGMRMGTGWKVYRFREGRREEIDLTKVVALEKKLGHLTHAEPFAEGSLMMARFTPDMDTSHYRLVDFATGEVVLEKEVQAKLGAGESAVLRSGVTSSNGRFLSAVVQKGGDYTGLVLLDTKNRSVLRFPENIYKPRWISDDGKLVFGKTFPGGEYGMFHETSGKVFPPEGQKVIASDFDESQNGKTLRLRVADTKSGQALDVTLSVPAMKVLRSKVRPADPPGYDPYPSMSFLGGRLRAYPKRVDPDAVDAPSDWVLFDEAGNEVGSGPGPSGHQEQCRDGDLVAFSRTDSTPQGGPPRMSMVFVDPERFLKSLAGVSAKAAPVESLAVDLRSKHAPTAARALVQARAQGLRGKDLSDPKFDGAAVGKDGEALVKALSSGLGSDVFATREKATASAKALLAGISAAAYAKDVAPTLNALVGDADAEIARRAKELVEYWAGRGRVPRAEIDARLAALEE